MRVSSVQHRQEEVRIRQHVLHRLRGRGRGRGGVSRHAPLGGATPRAQLAPDPGGVAEEEAQGEDQPAAGN